MTESRTHRASCLDWRPLHALLFLVLTVAALCVPFFRVWPFAMLVPLVIYGALVAIIPSFRASFQPWRFGEISWRAAIATFALAAGSCAILVAFHLLTRPDVSFLRGSLPVSSVGGLLAAGAFFSVLNAFLEEAIFRGIFFDGLAARWGAWPSAVITSIVFGYFHMHGYPPGPVGALLAGVYGLCLAWLRAFTGGLGWPVIAHITADATIFALLARAGAL